MKKHIIQLWRIQEENIDELGFRVCGRKSGREKMDTKWATGKMGAEDGIVRIEGKNAVYMDPVHVLSAAYASHNVKRDGYHSRALFSFSDPTPAPVDVDDEEGSRKRKRKKKKVYTLNEKEALAECRHQEVRAAIVEAHNVFQATVVPFLGKYLPYSSKKSENTGIAANSCKEEDEVDFVKLAALWQAPLYELSLSPGSDVSKVCCERDENKQATLLFNTINENPSEEAAVAHCAGCKYILPKLCKFLTSDVMHVHQLISGASLDRYNLMVIDPPWENKSVLRRALYPTLPNRYLLSLPVKQLAHADGALVALWITNREKLRQFAEKELFLAWGVTLSTVWFWLKVTEEGKMVSPLDLAHHKPYECLLLGYVPCQQTPRSTEEEERCLETFKRPDPPDKFVIISVPGDHSRKPPLGSILSDYVPGPRPVKGLELFARELTAGWTSWGNEPLRFQNLKYFQEKKLSNMYTRQAATTQHAIPE